MKQFAMMTVLACAPLLACSQQPAPAAAPAVDAAGVDAPKGFIARQVDRALDQARKELHASNLSLNGSLKINGAQVWNTDSSLPKGEISPQGDLLIDGKPVTITPAQRQQLLAYRGDVIRVAEAGMAIGSQGAELASKALGGAVGAIFGGEGAEKSLETRMEAEGKKIEAEAMKLCNILPPLLSSQQALAASLPAFQPYATMTRADIDECRKDAAEKKGGAVMSQ